MGMTLQETLRSLCHKSGWCYAVFWKLKRRSRMMLTWEDGYYEFAKHSSVSNDSSHVKSLFSGFENGENPFHQGVFGQDGCSMEDQIGLAVAKMSYQVYSLGEGIIGHVAVTGKHQWLFREKCCIGNTNSISSFKGRSMLEYPAGWQNQFAAGIKTVAVVAVVPHGVVQLGSTQMIMEDLELINHVRTAFGALQNVRGAFLSDCLQESLPGKIRGPIFPTLSASLSSPSHLPLVGTRASSAFRGQLNQSMLKNQSLTALDQFGSPLGIRGKGQSLQDKPCIVASTCFSGASAEILNRQSQFNDNGMGLNIILPPVTIEREAEMGGTELISSGARGICPFQGPMQFNSSLFDNQQALCIGSGTKSNRAALEEQQLQREMGLQGHPQLSSTTAPYGVQLQCQSGMPSAVHETPVLNPHIDRVDLDNTGNLMHSNFLADEGLLGSTMFEIGSTPLCASKERDMMSSVATVQYSVGRSGSSSASSKSFALTTRTTAMNTNPVPMVEADVGKGSYKSPTCSSASIQNCASDSRQPCGPLWSITPGHRDSGPLEPLGNGLVPSLVDGLLMPESFGLETQPWDKVISAKDISGLYQDSMVEKLEHVEGSSKNSEAGNSKLPAIVDDCGGSSGDALNDFDRYLKSLTKGQDNMSHAVSHLSAADELLQALGSTFKEKPEMDALDEMLLPRKHECNANLFTQLFGVSAGSTCLSNTTQSINASVHAEIEGGFVSDTKSENLLDAVVANLCPNVNQSMDDAMSGKTTSSRLSGAHPLYTPSVKIDLTSAGQVSGLDQKQSELVGLLQCAVNENTRNLQSSSFNSDMQGELAVTVNRLANEMPPIAQLNSWIDDVQSEKCENSVAAQTKKPNGLVKVNRKRARPGESGRPRPKDRQQIQDRVRELREIVPNGTKCSIDSLLERTIKHMTFLQSVAKHADNLKQSGESKVLDKDGSLLTKDGLEGGASWALELGGPTMGCPIIVENLNHPGQLLVEMLCEEQGLFLEIADIIRRLGLTILKGVMEVHNDKIWAHFVVEAKRDVHRVDILWSLVQLLQLNTKKSPMANSQPNLVRPRVIDSSSQTCNIFQQSPISSLSVTESLK